MRRHQLKQQQHQQNQQYLYNTNIIDPSNSVQYYDSAQTLDNEDIEDSLVVDISQKYDEIGRGFPSNRIRKRRQSDHQQPTQNQPQQQLTSSSRQKISTKDFNEVYSRLAKYEVRKQDKLRRQREQKDNGQRYSFKPKITQKAKNKKYQSNIIERAKLLKIKKLKKIQEKQRQIQEKKDQEFNNFTFRPQINKSSKKLLAQKRQNKSGFYENSTAWKRKKMKKQNELRNEKFKKDEDQLFKPKINENSKRILKYSKYKYEREKRLEKKEKMLRNSFLLPSKSDVKNSKIMQRSKTPLSQVKKRKKWNRKQPKIDQNSSGEERQWIIPESVRKRSVTPSSNMKFRQKIEEKNINKEAENQKFSKKKQPKVKKRSWNPNANVYQSKKAPKTPIRSITPKNRNFKNKKRTHKLKKYHDQLREKSQTPKSGHQKILKKSSFQQQERSKTPQNLVSKKRNRNQQNPQKFQFLDQNTKYGDQKEKINPKMMKKGQLNELSQDINQNINFEHFDNNQDDFFNLSAGDTLQDQNPIIQLKKVQNDIETNFKLEDEFIQSELQNYNIGKNDKNTKTMKNVTPSQNTQKRPKKQKKKFKTPKPKQKKYRSIDDIIFQNYNIKTKLPKDRFPVKKKTFNNLNEPPSLIPQIEDFDDIDMVKKLKIQPEPMEQKYSKKSEFQGFEKGKIPQKQQQKVKKTTKTIRNSRKMSKKLKKSGKNKVKNPDFSDKKSIDIIQKYHQNYLKNRKYSLKSQQKDFDYSMQKDEIQQRNVQKTHPNCSIQNMESPDFKFRKLKQQIQELKKDFQKKNFGLQKQKYKQRDNYQYNFQQEPQLGQEIQIENQDQDQDDQDIDIQSDISFNENSPSSRLFNISTNNYDFDKKTQLINTFPVPFSIENEQKNEKITQKQPGLLNQFDSFSKNINYFSSKDTLSTEPVKMMDFQTISRFQNENLNAGQQSGPIEIQQQIPLTKKERFLLDLQKRFDEDYYTEKNYYIQQ